jgi:hypothetical protein
LIDIGYPNNSAICIELSRHFTTNSLRPCSNQNSFSHFSNASDCIIASAQCLLTRLSATKFGQAGKSVYSRRDIYLKNVTNSSA